MIPWTAARLCSHGK